MKLRKIMALILASLFVLSCLASCIERAPDDTSSAGEGESSGVAGTSSDGNGTDTSDNPDHSDVSDSDVSDTAPVDDPWADIETQQVSATYVRHVFTHCLINDPQKGCATASGTLDIDCLTVSEFKGLLESLYKNGFCLININDMYVVDENGKARLADTVTVNKGKKPLVISIDDVTYDPKKRGSGMIDRLVIDNGTIMGCYDNADGTTTLTDGEVFPIIEQFVKEHPDFSYKGNKVTLALTGFAGILGYRTDEVYRGTYDVDSERQKAQVVVDWLKANGYNFASHSYSHADYSNISLNRTMEDIRDWKANVEPLIGETKVFVYPYGAFTYQDTEVHNALLKEGFVVFCGTSQLNTLWDNRHPRKGGGSVADTGTIYLERFTVTGFTLRIYGSRQSFYNYYVKYFKGLGYSDADAAEEAQASTDKRYDAYRQNSLEYYVPEEIYDHDNRYFKID